MCIAIHPNTSHPTGRPPARPVPGFPYNNCYHWIDTELELRVCARPEGFDVEGAIKLDADDQVNMIEYWALDHRAMWEVREARENGLEPPEPFYPPLDSLPLTKSLPRPTPQAGEQGVILRGKVDVTLQVPSTSRPRDVSMSSASTHSSYVSSRSESTTESSGRGMLLFGDSGKNVETLPLVHLWHDLANQLKQEDIPNPLGLFEERNAIVE